MADARPPSYEPLEPLRLSDVGVTGDRADTVIDVERVPQDVLLNKMAAMMVNAFLWGGKFEEWAKFNARISPYFEQFSGIVYRNVLADNPYNGGKLMLKNNFFAKYLNPETKQTEEKDLAKSGFWTPFMLAARGSWGPDASRVMNTLVALGHPMARCKDGTFDQAFIDETFPADVDPATGKPVEGGRRHQMDKLFSRLNTFMGELLQAFYDGIIRDSIEYAKERFRAGKKIAEAIKSERPFYEKGASEAVLRFYWEHKSCDVDITQELLDDLMERVKTALNARNASFMNFPELLDPKAPKGKGDWVTLPGTASAARPELNVMDGQHANKDDDAGGAAPAPGADTSAQPQGRKKTVTWKRDHAAAYKTTIDFKNEVPLSVAQSERHFHSQGLKTKSAKPLVTLLAATLVKGKPMLRSLPLSQVGRRHMIANDSIFRVRLAPKVGMNDKGLELRFDVMEVQVVGFYSAVMSINRPVPVQPIYSKGGAGVTRNLALDDSMSGMLIDALQGLSEEDLAQLDAVERAYIEAPKQKLLTAPPAGAKRPAAEPLSPAPAKKAAPAAEEPEEEPAGDDDDDLVD